MKAFRCAHLVEGCDFVIIDKDEDRLLLKIAWHARNTHGMLVTRQLVETVKNHVTVIDETPGAPPARAVA